MDWGFNDSFQDYNDYPCHIFDDKVFWFFEEEEQFLESLTLISNCVGKLMISECFFPMLEISISQRKVDCLLLEDSFEGVELVLVVDRILFHTMHQINIIQLRKIF